MTAVDSGRRALQFLGLDDEKSSAVGFDASLNRIAYKLDRHRFISVIGFSCCAQEVLIFSCFSLSGLEGGSDHNGLLYAWNDRIRIA